MNAIWEFFQKPLQEAVEEQQQFLSENGGRVDYRCITVLSSVAVILTPLRYHAGHDEMIWLAQLLNSTLGMQWTKDLNVWLDDDVNARYASHLFWASTHVVGYLIVPALIVHFFFDQKLSECGLKIRGMLKGWWIYAGMLLVMIPFIVRVSTLQSFLHTYPFYKLAPDQPLWPRLFMWELFYAAQFVALEFFFRGYMVHGTKRQFGPYSIFVMMVPYCMIHFGKPLPETFGAIFAGIILGFMSLKTRSVWMGAFLHISVAWTMDTLALRHTGFLSWSP